MSRLFASICNQPQGLAKALEPIRSSLVADGQHPRWGLGYAHLGEVCLRLHPKGSDDGVDFYKEMQTVKANYVLGAAHLPGDPLKGNANTQPFRFRRWLFAQTRRFQINAGDSAKKAEGETPKASSQLDRNGLLEKIPGYLQRNIKGATNEELLFHLFLATLHEDGTINNPNLDVADVQNALVRTLAPLQKYRDQLDNIVCTNSRVMLAVQLKSPLYVCRLSQIIDPKRPESAFRAIILVSSDTPPGDGFEPVPPGHAVAIARSVEAEIRPFL